MKRSTSVFFMALIIILFGLCFGACSSTPTQPVATESPQGEDQTSREPSPSATNTLIPTSTPAPASVQTRVTVPQGSPPTIDGTLSPGEWDDAAVEAFADGSELLLKQAGDYLYLGIRANTPSMIAGNVFINRGDEIAILHSSAALGTAIYQNGEDSWQQIQDFTWRCRDTSNSESAQAERSEFLLEEDWVAANARMGTPNELEYQIKVANQDLRLAVSFIRSSNLDEKIPWPPDLGDDCIKLTPGGFPSDMHFLPEFWGMIP